MLSNVIEKIAITAEHSEITTNDVFRALKLENESDEVENTSILSMEKFLQFQEKEYLRKILKFTKGNKAKAARLLEIDRATLWRKLVRYGLV